MPGYGIPAYTDMIEKKKNELMKTIESVGKKVCTGCGACYNACSKGAITMQQDDEGFLFPVIDHNKCINCGICLKSCAAYNPDYKNEKRPKCYAVWANDEIRKKSASGGAFSLLANYVLKQDGYVCGAAWDENFNVEHIVIHSAQELHKLQGVKYIQSTTAKTYSEIKENLRGGKLVLFVGTPCQVAGLKAYLQKEYENLITVDLVCHGAPSRGVWRRYIKEIAGDKQITRIQFRNKAYGWKQCLELHFSDGSVYRNVPPMDVFYETFFILLNTRESCHNCLFAKIPRQGDLTIGDGWECDPSMNDGKGTSEILINNEKGSKIFEAIKPQIMKFEDFDLEQAISGNVALTRPFPAHPERKRFFFLWKKKYSTRKSYDYAVNRKFDVGLLGIWFYQNYGSVLTTYALGKFLAHQGKEVLLVDNRRMFNPAHPALKGILNIRKFLQTHTDMEISRSYGSSEGLVILNKHVDRFITGSDQIFNWYLSVETKSFIYFQDFVDEEKVRIAYATSFGDGYNFWRKEYKICKPLLQKFDAISVREVPIVDIINNEFDINAVHNLDPVFLIDKHEYENIAKESKYTYGNYILAFYLDINSKKIECLDELAIQEGKDVIVISGPDELEQTRLKEFSIHHTVLKPDIHDWLYLFLHADRVITDSYHGMLFSVIFGKQFLAIENGKRGSVRFHSFLNMLGLGDRLILSDSNLTEQIKMGKESINYSEVYRILDRETNRSTKWLIDALALPQRRDRKIQHEIERLNFRLQLIEQNLRDYHLFRKKD